MDISDEAYKRSKMILGHMFELNSITDNVAYNMNFHYLNKMGDIYHLSFAHLFPGNSFADGLSDKMLELNARPIRPAMAEHSEEYQDAAAGFDVTAVAVKSLEKEIGDMIIYLESDRSAGNDSLRLFFENMLENQVTKVRKQADEWVDASHKLTEQTLNIHFEDYCHFIDIVK